MLDKDAFLGGLIANLQGAGLCAQRDPDDDQIRRTVAQQRRQQQRQRLRDECYEHDEQQ